MRRELALTDNQLELIKTTAAKLPQHQRGEFLEDVAAIVEGAPTDLQVDAAIRATIRNREIERY